MHGNEVIVSTAYWTKRNTFQMKNKATAFLSHSIFPPSKYTRYALVELEFTFRSTVRCSAILRVSKRTWTRRAYCYQYQFIKDLPMTESKCRYFKANNILLNEDFDPKLVDSGLGRLVSECESLDTDLVGTSSNVYGFGMILLELMTWKDLNAKEVLKKSPKWCGVKTFEEIEQSSSKQS
ncbi:hypothetical protein QVD17_23742 [Tagetes erecta]|uniref:Uncharacterized protein n=1 Tax=Tagetes erecta TaxID=13708 RepID=A0AAD8KKS9_TARER|nr:hypothetical protein QVD17_23742 [Tagetes erecta]